MNVNNYLVKWKPVLEYLDDIVISSKTVEQRMEQVQQVLILLKDAKGTLKLNNCSFSLEWPDYLGDLFRPKWFEIGYTTTEEIQQLKVFKNPTELRSLPGTCDVFRRFVLKLSHIRASLYHKLKKYQPTCSLVRQPRKSKAD